MTHIVNYSTKKAFKEAVEKDESRVYCDDPSMFGAVWAGSPRFILNQTGKAFTVTNHPKRSWFAEVILTKDGIIKVR